MNRIWRATINSWNGLVAVAQSELAFRQELVLFAIAIPLAMLLTQDFTRRFALIGTLVVVLVVELLNTAIEEIGNRITREHDRAIGGIKDIASAAVGVSLLFAASVWLWVFAERFWA